MQATFPFRTPACLDNDPEADALLARGPVVRAMMGPTAVWLALSHRAVRQVLADSRFSREAAIRPGGRPRMSPSGTARTTAWALSWPGWSCGWRSGPPSRGSPDLRLAVDPDELTYDTGHVVRAPEALPVEW
ncbi:MULTISPECIES: hypothetical protein [Streptomyces]|uniref:Cytochrome P450 n=2 Tax=Streptomyces TaxID=1883 RepID=A0ABV9IGH2_9ACTN